MKNKKMEKLLIVVIILLIIAGIIGVIMDSKNNKADKVITGVMYTGSEDNANSNAVAIKDDKIIFVGTKEEVDKYIGENTEVTNFKNGEFITTSLVDGHTHSTQYLIAANNSLCRIPDGSTAIESVAIIKKCIEEDPENDFIIANGWNNSAFGDLGPTSDLLDAIAGDKYVLATSSDGHSYWVTSNLLEKAGITKDTEDPKGGKIMRYSDGTPSGCLKDTAGYIVDKVKPEKSEGTYRTGILAADKFNIKQGYSIRFQAGDNENYDLNKAPVIDYSEKLDKEGKLNTYTQASFMINNTDDAVEMVDKAIEYKKKTKGGNFEVTTVKIFIDGIIENEGAYLSESYNNISNYYGTPRWETKEEIKKMGKVIAKANKNGMNVHFHVMGDKATSIVLEAMSYAEKEIGIDKIKESRNAFAHLGLVNENDYAKMKKYNIIAVLNPWAYMDPSYYQDQVTFLGKERASKQYPYKSFINNGVNIAFGTDLGASFTYNSIECFHVLTTRSASNNDSSTVLNSSEKLSRTEALDAMTKGGAYQLHKEDEFGTIEVGKYANFTVFDKNLLSIKDEEIMDTKVIKTMYKGKWTNE